MIVTLTLNPSIDRTIDVARLRRGAVLRARAANVDPGGKGVNVALALAAHGHKATAVLPCGGAEGRQLEVLLTEAGLDIVTVPIHGPVRSNVTVVEADGTTTKLNEPGPRLRARELHALIEATVRTAERAEFVVLSGSLPPGAPGDTYARLIARIRGTGTRLALDSSGPALAAAVATRPDVIKPNREELAELTARPVHTILDALGAARDPRLRGLTVLTSLGADGALLVDDAGAWLATPPPVLARSTVGAGDALLAGFLATGGCGPDALLEGVAWGSAAAALPGSRMPAPADIVRRGLTLTDLTRAGAAVLDRSLQELS